MNVWVFPGWLLGGGPRDGATVRNGGGDGLGVARFVVGDGVGLGAALAVGLGLGVRVGAGVVIGGTVGARVGTGDGVADKPANGMRPVPTIHTEISSAKVTRKLPMSSANRFIDYSESWMTVEPPAKPAALKVKRAVAPFWTSSLPVSTCKFAVPAALMIAVVSLFAP